MASRYALSLGIQPNRKISIAPTDIYHVFKDEDRLDKLAYQYYRDMTLSWVIMIANPDYYHEFAIKRGETIRIPMPLSRVWREISVNGERQ